MTDSQNTSAVFNGSYIVLACANGYTNTGASLNVTCLANSSWTQFPNCVSNTGSGSMATTTMPTGNGSMATTTISTGNGSPCMIDGATTFTIANGNYLSSSLAFASTTSATGNSTNCSFIIHLSYTFLGSIQFVCRTGYVLDPAIGGSYTCNNGVWSTKPQCLSKSYILHTHIFYMRIIFVK